MFLLLLAGDIRFCPMFSDPSLNGSRKQETAAGAGTCKEWSCGGSQVIQHSRRLPSVWVQSCTLDVNLR